MGPWEYGQLAAFVVVTSALLLLLDVGRRRVARERRDRAGAPAVARSEIARTVRNGGGPAARRR